MIIIAIRWLLLLPCNVVTFIGNVVDVVNLCHCYLPFYRSLPMFSLPVVRDLVCDFVDIIVMLCCCLVFYHFH